MRKILISYLLIGLISIQLIPFKELGETIFKYPLTQEILTDFENEEGGEKKQEDAKNKLELFHQVRFNEDHLAKSNSILYNIKNIDFNSRISDDIPTRPPSYFC